MIKKIISVKYFNTIDYIDKSEWNSIVDSNHILNSYDYLRAIEHSKINDFRYAYFMFYIDGLLVAHVQVGILTFGLDTMASYGLKKIFNFIKKIYPSFLKITLIESGFVSALGNSLRVSDNEYLAEILEIYDKELIKLAKREKTTLILVRDIYTREKENYDLLLKYKYKLFNNFPNTFLEINYNNFEGYINDLNAKRRHEVKRRLKVFYNKGCTVEKIVDFSPYTDHLINLWNQTFFHSKEYQREILNKDYFKFLSDYLKERSFILLCKKGNIPIGFTMFIDSGDTLISTYCGIDYNYNQSCYTYFVLFYESIKESIKSGKKWLELGITNYNPKIEIGAVPEPLYVYGKSINPLLNLFFVPLLKLTSISAKFQTRNVFSSRHFSRFDVGREILVIINKSKYSMINISSGGLAVIGENPLKKHKNVSIKIIDDEFEILAKVLVIYSGILGNNNWKIGLKILDMNNEYLIHWDHLVSKINISFGKQIGEIKDDESR